jgi:hypothetical protein
VGDGKDCRFAHAAAGFSHYNMSFHILIVMKPYLSFIFGKSCAMILKGTAKR